MRSRSVIGIVVLALLACILVAVPLLSPDIVAAGDCPHSFLEDDGPMEQFQWPLLAASVAIAFVALRRSRRMDRDYMRAVLLIYFLLFMREVDFDKYFLGDRWYDMTSYARDPDISVLNRFLLGTIFVVVFTLVYRLWARRKEITDWYSRNEWRPSHIPFTAGAFILAASVVVDRFHEAMARLGLHMTLSGRIYLEESLEFLGEALLLWAILILANRRPRRDRIVAAPVAGSD